MQPKSSADDLGMTPTHLGNSSLRSACPAWLRCLLRSFALSSAEIQLGGWMKERAFMKKSLDKRERLHVICSLLWSLGKGRAEKWIRRPGRCFRSDHWHIAVILCHNHTPPYSVSKMA